MYDMICEGLFVLDLVGSEANLLLKINLLSLKQIVKIKEEALMKFIERTYALLNKHIQSCNVIFWKIFQENNFFRFVKLKEKSVLIAMIKSEYSLMISATLQSVEIVKPYSILLVSSVEIVLSVIIILNELSLLKYFSLFVHKIW